MFDKRASKVMDCFCENNKTSDFKIEGDLDTDPIWCNVCGSNFDVETLPISSILKKELLLWGSQYGDWIDWNSDTLCINGIEIEDKHNKIGEMLAEKVKKELGDEYKVKFAPSSSARRYANSKKL